jgi:hypothetical protein
MTAVRMARCPYCKTLAPSSERDRLAFFEDRGPGSRDATESCVCGYAECAHDPEHMASLVLRDGKRRPTVVEDGRCKAGAFTPRGAAEVDSYYDGCRGWD